MLMPGTLMETVCCRGYCLMCELFSVLVSEEIEYREETPVTEVTEVGVTQEKM